MTASIQLNKCEVDLLNDIICKNPNLNNIVIKQSSSSGIGAATYVEYIRDDSALVIENITDYSVW